MSLLLSILVAVVVTAVVTWFLSQSLFAKSAVLPATHEAVKIEVEELRRELHTKTQLHTKAEKDCKEALESAQYYQNQLLTRSEALSTALAECKAANQNLEEAQAALQFAGEERRDVREALQQARLEIGTLRAKSSSDDLKLAEQKQFLTDAKESMATVFKSLAQDTLTANSRQISEQQKSKLEDTLQPFEKQLEAFRKDVEDRFREEGKEKTSLQKEVELLARSSQLLQKQATDLTEALRGSTKQQGDWGEGILERILEHCGLKEEIDYTIQSAEKAEDGSNYRPDVVLHMVGGRNLVIDSKVSLNAYWDMCGCEEEGERSACLPKICKALKAHIDELHRRPYDQVKGSPDFLIMFIPVEAAYITALQHDGSLWKYAYDKRVLLISPTNLIPFVRMVESMWDREKKYQNSMAIANKAAALYDKLANFVGNYEKVGNALRGAQKSYEESYAQLATGRGNLISKAEEMKLLSGSKHNLPEPMVNMALASNAISADLATIPTS